MMKKTLMTALMLAAAAACQMTLAADAPAKHGHEAGAPAPATHAVCVIVPMGDHKANGVIMLTQTEKGVQLEGEIKGLKPGEHGFHIHEFGDLRAADGTSAGGHYNPQNKPHAGPHDAERHVGDLGNVKANGEGVAKIDVLAEGAHLHYIIGRSLVVHADVDDFKTQKPPGNAGARVGVGVIGVAAAPMK
jgi:Cu-Zn family superoxide dismutase